MPSKSLPSNKVEPTEQTLLAEYSAANTIYLTYDGFRWQAGSFLIAGVFVYWGFLISNEADSALISGSALLIAALMSCWMLFANHYRQLYVFKLMRMHEIEAFLGMEQHRRFMKHAPSGIFHRAHGVKGHHIDALVYLLTSLGGVALALKKNIATWPSFVIVLALVGVVLLIVRHNELLLRRDLRRWAAKHED